MILTGCNAEFFARRVRADARLCGAQGGGQAAARDSWYRPRTVGRRGPMSLSRTALMRLIGLFAPGTRLAHGKPHVRCGPAHGRRRQVASAMDRTSTTSAIGSSVVRAAYASLCAIFLILTWADARRAGCGQRHPAASPATTGRERLHGLTPSSMRPWKARSSASEGRPTSRVRLHLPRHAGTGRMPALECGEYFLHPAFRPGRYALQGIEATGSPGTARGRRTATRWTAASNTKKPRAASPAYWFDDWRIHAARGARTRGAGDPRLPRRCAPDSSTASARSWPASWSRATSPSCWTRNWTPRACNPNTSASCSRTTPSAFRPTAKAAGRRADYLSNATLEYLRAGDSVTLAQINRQSGTFELFALQPPHAGRGDRAYL